ncbi:hypothetical protein lacNasYZ03_03990 [Lactobacillus nasalidis]|uniref:AI-2E family transporter n=1 Tax=Lactobacillus nasalidis TaxID=2797258 RepID=A0ABQ3W950_9LACO|nr:AI-2E family transporter [Lactobacillus nasalidis]GHV98095.1 hypothetical protein lacNasYZ01_12770 [Lactobacillus nasalidis]GHV99653.1 hypothetical protein lacNasYZ02_10830 [Lactobacillus nasalidis]GHW00712.1 hypothetical protein lacNasYZ03_03990 [Lactobacillus nasalidis]
MNKLWNHVDQKYFKIAMYCLATVFAGLLLLLLAYESTGFWIKLGKIMAAIAQPLTYGLVLTYLLMPLTNFFDRKFSKGGSKGAVATASRSMAVALTLLLLLLVLLLAVTAVFVTFSKQLSHISLTSLESLYDQLKAQYSSFISEIVSYLQKQGLSTSGLVSYLQKGVSRVTSFLSDFFFGLIFAIYFLYDGQRIAAYWKRNLGTLLNKKLIKGIKVFLADADQAFSGYIRGQIVDAFVVGLLVSLAMLIAKVPYGLLIGLVTGIGNLIPYFGPILGYGMVILSCVLSQNMTALLVGMIILLVIQAIDGNVLNPKLLSSAIHIHPLYVIACVIAGGAMGGFVGMLIAVPLGALLKTEFERLIAYRQKQLAKQGEQK